jgi:hypothetical protein
VSATTFQQQRIGSSALMSQLWLSAFERHGRHAIVGSQQCICCKQQVVTYTMTKFLKTSSAACLVVCSDCHKINNDSTSPYTWDLVLKQFGLVSRADSTRSTMEILMAFKHGQVARIRQKQKKWGIDCPFSGDIGCTLPMLQQHLEKQFAPGMTWTNHTTWGWHIDHVRPLNTVDVRNAADIESALHYTNLRPLWAKDNLNRMLRARGFTC